MGVARQFGQLAGEATDAYLDYAYVRPIKKAVRSGRNALESANDMRKGFAEGISGNLPPQPLPSRTDFTANERPSDVPLPDTQRSIPSTERGSAAPTGEAPEDYPLPLTPMEGQTISGELVAGPASYGRLPATREEAMPALDPGESPDEWASRLPPITVSKPAAPVVQGTIMKRGLPGSGDFGENLDMTPTRYVRQNPMSLNEARRRGMIIPGTPAPQPNFSNFHRGTYNPMHGRENAGMGMTGDAERAAMDNATRGERWGQGGSATRRRGRASAIVDQIRATRLAREQSRIRSDEALRTPQIQTGTYVGQAWVPDGKGGGRVQSVDATTSGRSPKPMTPAQAANIIKQAGQVRRGDPLKPGSADPDTADAMENMLRSQGVDVDALKGGAPDPAAKPAITGSAPQYKDGDTRVINGKTYTRKNGKWIAA